MDSMINYSLICLITAALTTGITAASIPGFQQRDTPGCGRQWDFAGETRRFTLETGGRERIFHVHLPAAYGPNDKAPLYIVYHGKGVEPLHIEEVTQLSNPDINPGVITVYPRGVDLAWEGPDYAEEGVSDLQFTSDLLEHLKDNFCIDTARIYATGHSNGGGFVNTLACDAEVGAPFAAFAGVASALYTDHAGNEGCNPARFPLPVLEAHGTDDDVIPYEGGDGEGGQLPALPDWLSRWAARNDCGERVHTELPYDVLEQSWECNGIEMLRHLRMNGRGHGYPTGPDTGINISPVIIDFFNGHRRPSD